MREREGAQRDLQEPFQQALVVDPRAHALVVLHVTDDQDRANWAAGYDRQVGLHGRHCVSVETGKRHGDRVEERGDTRVRPLASGVQGGERLLRSPDAAVARTTPSGRGRPLQPATRAVTSPANAGS